MTTTPLEIYESNDYTTVYDSYEVMRLVSKWPAFAGYPADRLAYIVWLILNAPQGHHLLTLENMFDDMVGYKDQPSPTDGYLLRAYHLGGDLALTILFDREPVSRGGRWYNYRFAVVPWLPSRLETWTVIRPQSIGNVVEGFEINDLHRIGEVEIADDARTQDTWKVLEDYLDLSVPMRLVRDYDARIEVYDSSPAPDYDEDVDFDDQPQEVQDSSSGKLLLILEIKHDV